MSFLMEPFHTMWESIGALRLEIRYDVSRMNEIDTLVRALCPGLEWCSLEYVFTKKFDTDKLIALCNKHGITIRSYDPSGISPIVVSAPGWGAGEIRPKCLSSIPAKGR